MKEENVREIDKKERKALKVKEKQEKKALKKKEKKLDKFTVLGKILAALLVIFMLIGTCYTFIYLVVNA